MSNESHQKRKNKTPAYWTLFPMKNNLFKLAVKMPLLPTFLKHSATLLPAVSFERCSAPHTITNHHAREVVNNNLSFVNIGKLF